jgi:septal ring factor EnvC (AmiA/AmiB activator)
VFRRGMPWNRRRFPMRSARGLLAVLILVSVSGSLATAATHALRDKQEDVRGRLAEVEDLVHDAGHEEERVERDVRDIQSSLRSRTAQVGELSGELPSLERDLTRARRNLRDAERNSELQRQQFATAKEQETVVERLLEAHLVALYKGGEPSVLEAVLGAQSPRELFDHAEFTTRLSKQSGRLVTELDATRSRLADARRKASDLEERRAGRTERLVQRQSEHRAALAAIRHERSHLIALRDQRRDSLAEIAVDRGAWVAEVDALRADDLRLQQLLREATRPPGTSAEPTASADAETQTASPPADAASSPSPSPPPTPAANQLAWPLSGTLTSPFGIRWGKLHTGIDIAAPAGVPIGAAAAGAVIYSGSFGGYGLLVVVNHGNGLSTAYAHNSSVFVAVGDSVAQGQAVAAVGCTGSCTGNHVHFEVRVDSVAVDPIGFL